MQVRNITNDRGNSVVNQFIITDGSNVYFQSYGSIIVKQNIKTNKTYLDRYYWDYSRTTGKYRNLFLGEGISDTRKKIDQGKYLLKDLNK
jgi:hypothetical protein